MKALLQEMIFTISRRSSQAYFDGDYGVYREENFIEILAFERKRSESSGKPFVLMMLTILGISELQSRRDTIRGAVEALSSFNRETDIKGWYRRPSTLGVIFTETDDIDTDTLRDKIYRRLHTLLTEAQVDAVQISFHTYPDDGSTAIPDNPAGFMFSPDSKPGNNVP